jgi:protein-disulfide isomerase/uncharacterized membrane protein
MRSNTTFLKIIVLLSLIGIGVSGKLLSIHNRFTTGAAGLTESCTVGGEGCNDVAASKYSEVAGVPLASIAMGYYFTLLLLAFWAFRNQQGANEPLYTAFFLSTLAVVVTVVMFSISNYVLGKFCQYCAMLWVVNLAVWPLLVKQLGLGWGNALGANAELLGGGKVNLRKDRLSGAFGIGLSCLLVFSAIGVAWKSNAASDAPAEDPAKLIEAFEKAPKVVVPADYSGGPSAKGAMNGTPVMDMVELGDFQCPGCKMAAQFLKPFVAAHPDKVRLTFHNYPLDNSCNPAMQRPLHMMACTLARGSLCAARQGKFWEYHDQIYARQSEENGPGIVDDVVKDIGLDTSAFQACLKDFATEMTLQKDMQLGELVGLESTPTLIINGHKMVGGHSPAALEALLGAIEKGAK